MTVDITPYLAGWRERARKERQAIENRRTRAIREAEKIARFLGEIEGVTRVVGIGSAFDPDSFSMRSDIDLVVMGLPKDKYFTTLGQIMTHTDFEVDLIPFEDARELLKSRVAKEGVPLWP